MYIFSFVLHVIVSKLFANPALKLGDIGDEVRHLAAFLTSAFAHVLGLLAHHYVSLLMVVDRPFDRS